jgi:hypothetical protein
MFRLPSLKFNLNHPLLYSRRILQKRRNLSLSFLSQLLNLNPSKPRLNTKQRKSITAMKNQKRKEMTISTVKFTIVVMRRMTGTRLEKTSQKVPKTELNQAHKIKRDLINK